MTERWWIFQADIDLFLSFIRLLMIYSLLVNYLKTSTNNLDKDPLNVFALVFKLCPRCILTVFVLFS